jgi:hypothetical protein
VLGKRLGVDDGVDSFGADAELQRHFHVGGTVGVDEGIHLAAGGRADPVDDAVTVGDLDEAVALEPFSAAI